MERALLAFFERVARRDAAQMKKITREPSFGVERERWCFTLPDLHRFLREQDDAFSRVDYKKFRRLLLASPVNRALKPHGAEIAIADNRGKVDRSRYALVWRT
jgi:hypothetical protein